MIDLSKFAFIERPFRSLSLAIQLFDRSAQDLRPSGDIAVSLKGLERKVIRNPSGHFVYLGLENGDYTVCIESAYYIKTQFDVTIPQLVSPPPPQSRIDLMDNVSLKSLGDAIIASVDLMPDVNYPFPPGATLVHGEVVHKQNGTSKPVSEAKIRVSDMQASPPEETKLEFQANPKGQFILFMNKLTKKVIKEINGKVFNGQKAGDKPVLMLQVISPVVSKIPPVDVKYGKTTYIKIEI